MVVFLMIAPTTLAQQKTPAQQKTNGVLTGIDVLQRDGFRQLKGRRVGLITNHTGIDRSGRSTAEILHQAPGVELAVLFSPEHGQAGKLDQANIPDSRDEKTGLRVYSLYGKTRRPTEQSLQNIDTLVFDIQDIGARFYTYISTMGEAMKAAAKHKRRFVVLDRPNPINGVDVSGPVLDDRRQSFVGFHRLPVRHGMTVGELAKMFRGELNLELDLEVIPVEGWRRGDFFDATNLLWTNPSPNMRNLNEALLYPGIGLLETTNLSVGRGTDTPFERLGAPWLNGRRLAQALNAARLPGVRFVPLFFTPTASVHKNQRCGGVHILITDRRRFRPLLTGLEIAYQLRRQYPQEWRIDRYDRLLGSAKTLQGLKRGLRPAEILELSAAEREEFIKRRAKYLIYSE